MASPSEAELRGKGQVPGGAWTAYSQHGTQKRGNAIASTANVAESGVHKWQTKDMPAWLEN